AVAQGLLAGEAVIGTALSQRLKLHVGDSITLATREGDQAVRVAGVVTEYVAGGMAMFLERETARRLFKLDGVDVFMLTARPGETAHLGEGVQQFCRQRGLMLQSNAEFRQR